MVNEIKYTTIKRVLDDITEHPMLRKVTLEQAVRHAVRFIGLFGLPMFYKDKRTDVEIKEFRGVMPCDLISIVQVRDKTTGVCLRSMTDTFVKGLEGSEPPFGHKPPKDLLNNARGIEGKYIPPKHWEMSEPSFKTQGRVIYTSFPHGCVEIEYKAIPVDDDGFPLIIDNETYLAALEAYIKEQVFTVLFDTGKINGNVLQNAKQEYAFRAAELQGEMRTPSLSEMQTITNILNTLIVPMRHFDNGFERLGDREYLRRH